MHKLCCFLASMLFLNAQMQCYLYCLLAFFSVDITLETMIRAASAEIQISVPRASMKRIEFAVNAPRILLI